jgi:hypothetical protein
MSWAATIRGHHRGSRESRPAGFRNRDGEIVGPYELLISECAFDLADLEVRESVRVDDTEEQVLAAPCERGRTIEGDRIQVIAIQDEHDVGPGEPTDPSADPEKYVRARPNEAISTDIRHIASNSIQKVSVGRGEDGPSRSRGSGIRGYPAVVVVGSPEDSQTENARSRGRES